MTLADRIVVMQDGIIEQIGTPLELYDNPINQFVATFIGAPSMNLLDGVLSKGIVKVGEELFVGPKGAGKVKLGVRPEHLILAKEGGLPMQVKVVEPTGAETMVFLRFEGQDITAVFRERHSFESGQTIYLKPDPNHLHVFEDGTGERL